MPASRNEPGADPEGADGRGQTTPVQDRNFADEPVIRADMSRDGEVVNAKGDACPSCGSNETFEFKGAHGDNMSCSICDRTWDATRKNTSDTEEKLKKAGFAWTTSGSGDAYIIYRAGRDPQASMVADSKISLEDAAKKVLKNASDTGLCYDCSHPGTAHNPTCEGEGGKPCSLNCKHFVKRDSDGGPNKPRKNAKKWTPKCPKCKQDVWDVASGYKLHKCHGCGTAFDTESAANYDQSPAFQEEAEYEDGRKNAITGDELMLRLKGRRNAGVAAGEAKYGSRENSRLRCDMRADCNEPVSYVDNKGFVYCDRHGQSRKSAVSCRKLTASELKKLEAGELISY